jgi:predicted enzyme related to lactoylglutathione lyase
MTRHALHWAEIPVADFDRACRFYGAIFDIAIPTTTRRDRTLGLLPFEPGRGVGAAIVFGEGLVPSATGTLVYLAAGPDLALVLGRVVRAGGVVLQGKAEIGPQLGFSALFRDSEGNRVGLHSPE